MPEHARRCRVCGHSLEGRRIDARTCSARCRREANRLEHLLAGREDTGYRNLDEYLARRQRRATGAGGA